MMDGSFISRKRIGGIVALSFLQLGDFSGQERPNIVMVSADDMGHSDIGCYGSEIETPHVDSLALQGIRPAQFYNTSRSCPTRASLMAGLYQYQAEIGWISEDPFKNVDKDPKGWGVAEYKGALNRNCVTIAEVLKSSGYHTCMAGKWYLETHGMEKWPLQRGFERFCGILVGACSYLRPEGERGLILNNEKLPAPGAPYYTTDTSADYAVDFIDEQKDNAPFFLYSACNTPHRPLQAKEADIEKYYRLYRMKGWDQIHKERHKHMANSEVVDSEIGFAEWKDRQWEELSEAGKDHTTYRMTVYAAQVHCMGYDIGELIESLRKSGKLDNTSIFFVSDNGTYAKPHNGLGGGKQKGINNPAIGNHPSCGKTWAQASNTPFRKYKQRACEGGISTPLVITQKNHLKGFENTWCHVPGYLPDIMPTMLNVTGATYPSTFHSGNKIHPLVDIGLAPAIEGKVSSIHGYMYREHQGSRAVRQKNWKAVWDREGKVWELYDTGKDRVEACDLSAVHPGILRQLSNEWAVRAAETKVLIPFPNNKK